MAEQREIIPSEISQTSSRKNCSYFLPLRIALRTRIRVGPIVDFDYFAEYQIVRLSK